MKITKKRWGDILWVLAIVILLFTPLGKTIKVQLNKLFSFEPILTEQPDAVHLKDYNWFLKDLETGKSVNLNAYKGQVIFINHWATYCPPCLAEMPDINALYKDYKDKMVFLMVTSDKQSIIDTFMKREGYHFKNYTSYSQSPQELKSELIPQTIIIDQEGYIRINKIGSAKWNDKDFRDALDGLIKPN